VCHRKKYVVAKWALLVVPVIINYTTDILCTVKKKDILIENGIVFT
jgi:hypothetical protein